MIHKLADCQSSYIPDSTNIWQYVVILPNARIGSNCNICSHCFIENDVILGNNVTLKNGVYLWNGITIEDNVFIGPNVTFTNDKYPRSKHYPEAFQRILLKRGCSIGAGSIILGGITVGENAMIAAGSIITKDVPANELWMCNPARSIRRIEI